MRGHLIAASADVPFSIWLIFNAFVQSIGHCNFCFTSGNQFHQLDSSFAKHSFHSVTLRLSCLYIPSFVRLNIKSTQNDNPCLLSRYSITQLTKLLLDTTAFFSSSLSSKSFTNVRSFFTCSGTISQYKLHAYQTTAFYKSFGLSSISV